MDTTNKPGVATFTTPSDRELTVTRVVDAARRLVFDAWTNPEHLPHWFGPRDWTLATCSSWWVSRSRSRVPRSC